MPEITIRSFAKFRELFGETNKVTVSVGANVLEAVYAFAKTNPAAESELFADGELKNHIILMYNRERIDSEEAASTKVLDGDEIVIYPPVSGG